VAREAAADVLSKIGRKVFLGTSSLLDWIGDLLKEGIKMYVFHLLLWNSEIFTKLSECPKLKIWNKYESKPRN
jgi:hypothetical protein